jgi:hypothetical protein
MFTLTLLITPLCQWTISPRVHPSLDARNIWQDVLVCIISGFWYDFQDHSRLTKQLLMKTDFKNPSLIFAVDSVADPDPNPDPYPSDLYVFGPPGSGSGSILVSPSINKQKKIRKTLIPTAF